MLNGAVAVELKLIYGDNEDRVQPDHGSENRDVGLLGGAWGVDTLSRKFNFAELYRSRTRDSSV